MGEVHNNLLRSNFSRVKLDVQKIWNNSFVDLVVRALRLKVEDSSVVKLVEHYLVEITPSLINGW